MKCSTPMWSVWLAPPLLWMTHQFKLAPVHGGPKTGSLRAVFGMNFSSCTPTHWLSYGFHVVLGCLDAVRRISSALSCFVSCQHSNFRWHVRNAEIPKFPNGVNFEIAYLSELDVPVCHIACHASPVQALPLQHTVSCPPLMLTCDPQCQTVTHSPFPGFGEVSHDDSSHSNWGEMDVTVYRTVFATLSPTTLPSINLIRYLPLAQHPLTHRWHFW